MRGFPSKYSTNSSQSIGFSFIKVYNLWNRQIKVGLSSVDITHPQFVVLASIGYLSQQLNEVNQVDVAKHSDMDVMTVSTIIKNLEKKEIILRKTSAQDTRAKSVLITKKGIDILNKSIKIVEEIDETFFSKLGKDDELFNNMLHSLVRE
jgi:DNA-binding MarR family transcriptional regulator